MSLSSKIRGILIPVIGIDGLIQGFQIRMDIPFDDKRYIWFSSTDKQSGTSSKSPIHFVGNVTAETIILTEGPLKGNVIHALTDVPVLAIAGVNQIKELSYTLSSLKSFGLKKVMVALDIDRICNKYVRRAMEEIRGILVSLNLIPQALSWDFRRKGYDDYIWAEQTKTLRKSVPFFIQNRISCRLFRSDSKKIRELVHISSHTKLVENIPMEEYSQIFEGEVKAKSLEDLFIQFFYHSELKVKIYDILAVEENGKIKYYCAAPDDNGFIPADIRMTERT